MLLLHAAAAAVATVCAPGRPGRQASNSNTPRLLLSYDCFAAEEEGEDAGGGAAEVAAATGASQQPPAGQQQRQQREEQQREQLHATLQALSEQAPNFAAQGGSEGEVLPLLCNALFAAVCLSASVVPSVLLYCAANICSAVRCSTLSLQRLQSCTASVLLLMPQPLHRQAMIWPHMSCHPQQMRCCAS